MEFKLYAYLRCAKSVKSTSGLTRHDNACKISNSLPYCQSSNPKPVLDYNTAKPPKLAVRQLKRRYQFKRIKQWQEKNQTSGYG